MELIKGDDGEAAIRREVAAAQADEPPFTGTTTRKDAKKAAQRHPSVAGIRWTGARN